MGALIRERLVDFDLIVLELPPILSSRATPQLARLSSGVLLSSIAGETIVADINDAGERLLAARVPLLGEISHAKPLVRPIFVADDRPDEASEDGSVDPIDLRVVNDGS